LEDLINDEIKAQHFVVAYRKTFLIETNAVLKNYVIINKQMKALNQNNQISQDENDLVKQMRNHAKEIDTASM
jgi:hypothetical protein